MVHTDLVEHLRKALEEAGARWRLIPLGRLGELEAEFAACRTSGELDDTFSRMRISHFSFTPPDQKPEAAAVIILAVQQPQIKIGLVHQGKRRNIVLPPTYISAIDAEMLAIVQNVLRPWGHWASRALLPLKLLAARSGLIQYGKNNIGYIDGFGSYFRLMAFFTDLAPLDYGWGPLQSLERCTNCSRCVDACRLDAIRNDRFLLHAERCLVYHNERAGEFPEWIDPSVHHCIMGCMFCQRACPENKGLLTTAEITEPFGEEEVSNIMEGIPKERLDAGTVDKLTRLELFGDYELLGRNLKAILDRPVWQKSSPLGCGKC